MFLIIGGTTLYLDCYGTGDDTQTVAAYAVKRLVAKEVPVRPRRRVPRSWTEDELLDAIRSWADRHGSPPTSLDWDPSRARRLEKFDQADRHAEGNWPTTNMVCAAFGTLNAAVAAAGLEPRRSAGRKSNLAGPHVILDAIRTWTLR
jgi:hypothetical protein